MKHNSCRVLFTSFVVAALVFRSLDFVLENDPTSGKQKQGVTLEMIPRDSGTQHRGFTTLTTMNRDSSWQGHA